MRRRRIIYWVATGLVVLVMTASGSLAIMHAAPMEKALSHLGYPGYFLNLLGAGKLMGVCVLLLPGMPKMKEWAYVGFGITVLSACYSHYCAGDGVEALEPMVTFAALVVSYKLSPAVRRLHQPIPTEVAVR